MLINLFLVCCVIFIRFIILIFNLKILFKSMYVINLIDVDDESFVLLGILLKNKILKLKGRLYLCFLKVFIIFFG